MNVKTILSPGKYFLIGIILIASSYILPTYFNQTTIQDSKPLKFDENTRDNMTTSFAKSFSLKNGYHCSVEITDRYGDDIDDVNIMFLKYADYLDELDPGSDPTGVTGEYFIWRYSNYPSGISSGAGTKLDVTAEQKDVVFKIDFMGTGSGGNLRTRPGKYVAVIYGQNTAVNQTQVQIDLKISVDGLGDTLKNITYTAGWIVILAACVIAVVYVIYNRKNR